VDEHVPSSKKRSRRNQKAPTRGHVANLLGMKAATPRSLAYVAVQVPNLLFPLGYLKKISPVTLRTVECQRME
jgi:uncharacterized alpha-E superfamily protein